MPETYRKRALLQRDPGVVAEICQLDAHKDCHRIAYLLNDDPSFLATARSSMLPSPERRLLKGTPKLRAWLSLYGVIQDAAKIGKVKVFKSVLNLYSFIMVIVLKIIDHRMIASQLS